MDRMEFRRFLVERNVSGEQIERALVIAERFERYLAPLGAEGGAATADAKRMDSFSDELIRSGENTLDNYEALARYAAFVRNRSLYTAVLEYLDGHEALASFHRAIGAALGRPARDEIFRGVALPPLGTPNVGKYPVTATVIARAEQRDPVVSRRVLSGGLRDLKDEWFLAARRTYEEAGGIDKYLERKGAEFIEELQEHRREGRWWFVQEITDEVIDCVQRHPEIRSGVRVGAIIYETKIPYMTKEYLAESDERMRRYFYCHCPWVRESLRTGSRTVSPTFCLCSGAFHKKPYEVIFGRPLRVDVVESVLRGDARCRFAIHLPDGAV